MRKLRTVLGYTGVTLALLFAAATQAALDNKGTEFILGYLPNFDTDVTIELHLTGDVATMVTVEYPVNAPTFTTTVAIVPGDVTIVELPDSIATNWVANNTQNNLVRASASDEFVAYQINLRPFSSDAALGLPVDVMNTEYLAMTWDATFAGEFMVYAAFNNTTVTITPNNNIVGHAAGVPFDVVLNRGDGYLAQSVQTGASGNLTGSRISASRPVGLVNGNRCTNVPQGVSFCDHIFEVAQPVQTWGGEVLAANLPNRAGGSYYEVLAALDNTEIFVDGVSNGTINAAQYMQIGPLTGDHRFSSQDPDNVPIYVGQFMTGSGSPGAGGIGDPAQGNMIPAEQYLTSYTFSTVGGAQFAQNFLTIIAHNTELDDVMLDGVNVGAGAFSVISDSNFSSAVLPLSDGPHTSESPVAGFGHGITVEGYNNDDSYIYPGGARFEFITAIGDANPPLCSAQTLAGPPPSVTGSGEDSRPTEDVNGNGVLDPGEDLNNNGQIDKDTGIFSVTLAAGAINLSLNVDAFIPGDPMATYQVNLTDPGQDGSGTVLISDGSGNTCQQIIDLDVTVQPPMCDMDADNDVDRIDIGMIFAMLGTVVTPGEQPDLDGDGIITVLDGRLCVLQCTLNRCEIPPDLAIQINDDAASGFRTGPGNNNGAVKP